MTEKVEMNSEKGKETLDALMAKMSPEQQEKFKASLNGDKPVHVHVDKDGAVSFGETADIATGDSSVDTAPEEIVEIKKEEPKKPSKIDLKRQKIYMDRLKRKMGNGLTQAQALQVIQREDYDAMPVDKKLVRLEAMVSRGLQNLAEEMLGLSQNQHGIGDAFDINYRAIGKLFTKLGVTEEDQKAIMAEAQKEHLEARAAFLEARKAEQQKQAEEQRAAAEQANVASELKNAETIKADGAPEGAEIPKEATVFGG